MHDRNAFTYVSCIYFFSQTQTLSLSVSRSPRRAPSPTLPPSSPKGKMFFMEHMAREAREKPDTCNGPVTPGEGAAEGSVRGVGREDGAVVEGALSVGGGSKSGVRGGGAGEV